MRALRMYRLEVENLPRLIKFHVFLLRFKKIFALLSLVALISTASVLSLQGPLDEG